MNLENTKAQMKKGILEMCVLGLIAKQEAYPSDIIKQLKSNELIVVEGTLYPLLNRLKNSGLLEYYWQESNSGPPRKYYRITEQGNSFLGTLINSWERLSNVVSFSTQSNNNTDETDH